MTFIRGAILSIGLSVLAALVLYIMGQPLFSNSGQILWWVGELGTAEGSQQISDWYSPSHFIHGIVFFGFLYLFRRWLSLGTRLAIATVIELGWEILENSPIIIDRYREVTIAFGYSGDSILNSMCDVGFMIIGFFFARFAPWWMSLLIIISLELFVGLMIRDNLTLNILMLVYPIEAVRVWQGG